ncbi:hypothetical protein J5N97_019397 [Dioscorea zingiberensis]|uniref:Uncharacterized protein n=1 Tax=Dioscorea zingiberensis TaxID=325984 RepID=A0A9D5CEV4_9LILI|nr:hypothetical protein J5N97_019397 [Dioscorea zingiberensis]
MPLLFGERKTLANSHRESSGGYGGGAQCFSDLSVSSSNLPSPFGKLGSALSDAELREIAYEIFIAACRTTSSKPLLYHSEVERADRSLTSTMASKMKKALGLKKGSPTKPPKRPATIGELMRVRMGVSQQADERLRRALIKIVAGKLGKRMESMVLPLELLHQLKASDFPSQQEYELWQMRKLKILEVGLLVHPHLPLGKGDFASEQLQRVIRGALEKPLETEKNSESMQVLKSSVAHLARRSLDGSSPDTYHWADGSPLNLHLYQRLLEACYYSGEGAITEEIDEIMELIKKTWVILGVNKMLHNLCLSWIFFHRYITTGQAGTDLLFSAANQLTEVAQNAKATKDTVHLNLLRSTLNSIMDWTEKRLLAYHDTFSADNVDSMQSILSFAVLVAKILAEVISKSHYKRREELDVVQSKIETYIRSSLRTAFAQRMEKVYSSQCASKSQTTSVLSILAADIQDLAHKEIEVFSPILRKWHPLAAGIAVATLHVCYGNELKQFISSVTELTSDSIQVLKAADKLEEELMLIAVKDSADSDDRVRELIHEMRPYDTENTIANVMRSWIKRRVDQLKEWVDKNLRQEIWNPRANKEKCASSAVEALRIVDETLDAYFQLPILMHSAFLPDLVNGLDKSLQYYVLKTKHGCGTRDAYLPAYPTLTRCHTGSKLWKKKEQEQNVPTRKSQSGSINRSSPVGFPQLCVRMNTMNHIRTKLGNFENKIIMCLRNVVSSQSSISNGLDIKFDLCQAACEEGIQQLCESTAYKVIFHDLCHVLWDYLYVGGPASSRIEPLLKELETTLEIISDVVNVRLRDHVITAIMKTSYNAFLRVLLAGGPSRAFSHQDYQILEDDFTALKGLFMDELPEELVEKASTQVRNVLGLHRLDTANLIELFKQMITEAHGSVAKSIYPPPTSGYWSPTEANTVLRVLCHRDDKTASKFLKQTYDLPKKL